MSKESKEIREIMDDMNQLIAESYVFGRNSNKIIPEGDDELSDDEMSNDLTGGEMLNNLTGDGENMNNQKNGGVGIDSAVKEMRKIALSVVMKMTPDENPEDYKLVKGIWDVCDKFLTKDTKDIKLQQNQNNN